MTTVTKARPAPAVSNRQSAPARILRWLRRHTVWIYAALALLYLF